MRGPSEGLHEGPALGRGRRGKGATPQPVAGPRGRDRHAAPPPGVRRRRQGTRGTPHSPPPPSHSGPRADGGRPKKRRPGTPPEEAAAPGVRGHQGRGRRAHALPAAGRRRTGGAQDSANGAALSEAGPGKTGARTRAGRFPPPPPPPPPPHWPVGGRPDRAGRPRPPRNPHGASIPRGGTPVTTDGRPTPDGAGGRGGAPPPPAPPAQLGSHRSGPPPPRGRGDAPLPQKGPRRGEGGCGWTGTPRAPAPPAACFRGGRGRRASPHQRARAKRAPSLGAAHGGAPEQYGGRALHDPPVTTAHSGRAEGGFRSAGAPGGAVHGPPLIPPNTPGRHRDPGRTRTPEGSAPTTRGGPGLSTAGRHPEGEQGGRGATPSPHPPHRPTSRGGPGPHPPRQGGCPPPPPARGAGARPAPPPQPSAPTGAAENKPARANAPGRRTDRAQRRRTSTNRSGMGGHAPFRQHDASDTRFVACPGKAEGRNEAERPPALQPPPGRTNGGYGARPPPPARPPAQGRHGPAPRRAAPTGRAGRGDREGPQHPHARAHNTWIADPNSPPSGRAVGKGGALNPRRPSQQ